MVRLFELAFTASVIVCAILAGQNNERPYRVDMCLVGSGPNGEDMSTEVWTDMIEQYKERYPGSYCGKCGMEKPCPKRGRK